MTIKLVGITFQKTGNFKTGAVRASNIAWCVLIYTLREEGYVKLLTAKTRDCSKTGVIEYVYSRTIKTVLK
jgi:hypothetical protein